MDALPVIQPEFETVQVVSAMAGFVSQYGTTVGIWQKLLDCRALGWRSQVWIELRGPDGKVFKQAGGECDTLLMYVASSLTRVIGMKLVQELKGRFHQFLGCALSEPCFFRFDS